MCEGTIVFTESEEEMKRNQGFHLCFVSVEILEMGSQPFMLYLCRSNEISWRWRRSVQPSSGQEAQKLFLRIQGL